MSGADGDAFPALLNVLLTSKLGIENLEQFTNRIQRNDETWGFLVYRTVYTPESDISFPRAIDRLTQFIRTGLELSVNAQKTPAMELVRMQFIKEIMHRFRMIIFEDADEFDGCGADRLSSHFDIWMLEQEFDPEGSRGLDAVFLYIDEDSLRDIMIATHPERRVWSGPCSAALPRVKIVDVNPEPGYSFGPDRVLSTTVCVAWDLWRYYFVRLCEYNL